MAVGAIALSVTTPPTATGQAPATKAPKCDSLYTPFLRLRNGPAYNSCAVDVPPMPQAATIARDVPHWSGEFDAAVTFIVNRDGHIDSTTVDDFASSTSLLAEHGPVQPTALVRSVLHEMIFDAGTVRGVPVRAVKHIVFSVESAPDSLPAVGRWKYFAAAGADSMLLQWKLGAPLTIRDAKTAAAVLLAAEAELRISTMDYRAAPRGWNGCSVIGAGVPFADAVRTTLHQSRTPLSGDEGCPAHDANAVRWTALFRVSETTFVVRLDYPVGKDAWSGARCWVERARGGWRAGCG